jgi:hypothetical protein
MRKSWLKGSISQIFAKVVRQKTSHVAEPGLFPSESETEPGLMERNALMIGCPEEQCNARRLPLNVPFEMPDCPTLIPMVCGSD